MPARRSLLFAHAEGNLNETGAEAVAETMVQHLLPSGYDILTIDGTA